MRHGSKPAVFGVAANGPKRPMILIVCLAACLGSFIGCQRLFSKPEAEIQLPDGAIPGILPLDAAQGGANIVGLMAINFSGRSISNIAVDDEGGLLVGSDFAALDGGMSSSLPKDLQAPFYVRVAWQDTFWYERVLSQRYGPTEATYGISKSKLVKITKPLPPLSKTLLVIFYPNDRVECEVLGEHPNWEERTDELLRVEESA